MGSWGSWGSWGDKANNHKVDNRRKRIAGLGKEKNHGKKSSTVMNPALPEPDETWEGSAWTKTPL